MSQPIELSQASIVRLEPGDFVALKVARHITPEEAYELQKQWQQAMQRIGKPDIGVVILSPDVDLTVVARP